MEAAVGDEVVVRRGTGEGTLVARGWHAISRITIQTGILFKRLSWCSIFGPPGLPQTLE
jgi:hypothetical protein